MYVNVGLPLVYHGLPICLIQSDSFAVVIITLTFLKVRLTWTSSWWYHRQATCQPRVGRTWCSPKWSMWAGWWTDSEGDLCDFDGELGEAAKNIFFLCVFVCLRAEYLTLNYLYDSPWLVGGVLVASKPICITCSIANQSWSLLCSTRVQTPRLTWPRRCPISGMMIQKVNTPFLAPGFALGAEWKRTTIVEADKWSMFTTNELTNWHIDTYVQHCVTRTRIFYKIRSLFCLVGFATQSNPWWIPLCGLELWFPSHSTWYFPIRHDMQCLTSKGDVFLRAEWPWATAGSRCGFWVDNCGSHKIFPQSPEQPHHSCNFGRLFIIPYNVPVGYGGLIQDKQWYSN